MPAEIFIKDNLLPFVEGRYSKSSQRRFKPHMHTRYSIGAVDCGEVQYSVAEQNSILRVNSLALINPETLHSCNSLSSRGRSYYMLYLDIDWFNSVAKSLYGIDMSLEFHKINLNDEQLYKKYCATMKLLMNLEVPVLEREQVLVDLIIPIIQSSCRPQPDVVGFSYEVNFLKKYLAENLNTDITVNSLAQKLDMNPYTLLRSFKLVTGITPHAYRINCRLEQARKFLQQGMDISETALNCGFFDQSHLHHYFKSVTTVTPREYLVNFLQ